MKRCIKRVSFLVLGFLMLTAIFAGCEKTVPNENAVIKIGSFSINLDEYQELFDTNAELFKYYEALDLSTKEKLEAFQDYVYTMALKYVILLYQADKNSVTLDETEMLDVEKQLEEKLASVGTVTDEARAKMKTQLINDKITEKYYNKLNSSATGETANAMIEKWSKELKIEGDKELIRSVLYVEPSATPAT
ncbi:MAG: hypothetical protein RRY79_03740 [Clostridia bacterium]